MTYFFPEWVSKELRIVNEQRFGDFGRDTRKIQEWLVFHKYRIGIDGFFGDATLFSVKRFQKNNNLIVDGIVGNVTFKALSQPLLDTLITVNSLSLFKPTLLTIAKIHLRTHPIELGGQNKGPWVRTYMRGYDGEVWAWCAGFVSFILQQVAYSLHMTTNKLDYTFSVDNLANQAKSLGIFIPEGSLQPIKPGYIFLNRRSSIDWTHTGFVLNVGKDVFTTIEGNSNTSGSREGYEVTSVIRSYKNRDFIKTY